MRRREGRSALSLLGLGSVSLAATVGVLGLYLWQSEPGLPDEAEAAAIFTGLHRDIYRAFDHDEEGAIYDALAGSVDGRLLDRIYVEVYEALVMSEHGGARAKVHEVEMLDRQVLGGVAADRDGPSFRVRAQWEVTSSVVHEGHEHVRVVEYEGLYTVARREEGWRIVDDKILTQKPVPYLGMPEPLG